MRLTLGCNALAAQTPRCYEAGTMTAAARLAGLIAIRFCANRRPIN